MRLTAKQLNRYSRILLKQREIYGEKYYKSFCGPIHSVMNFLANTGTLSKLDQSIYDKLRRLR